MATPTAKGNGILCAQVPALAAKLKPLFNRDLQDICVSANLPKTGVKSALQHRIVSRKSLCGFRVSRISHLTITFTCRFVRHSQFPQLRPIRQPTPENRSCRWSFPALFFLKQLPVSDTKQFGSPDAKRLFSFRSWCGFTASCWP